MCMHVQTCLPFHMQVIVSHAAQNEQLYIFLNLYNYGNIQ